MNSASGTGEQRKICLDNKARLYYFITFDMPDQLSTTLLYLITFDKPDQLALLYGGEPTGDHSLALHAQPLQLLHAPRVPKQRRQALPVDDQRLVLADRRRRRLIQ